MHRATPDLLETQALLRRSFALTPTALKIKAQGKHERATRVLASPWVTQEMSSSDEQNALQPNHHGRVAAQQMPI